MEWTNRRADTVFRARAEVGAGLRRLFSRRWRLRRWRCCLQSSIGEQPPEIAELPPTPTPPPPATAPPAPTATATAIVELASDWVTVSSPEDTPTPWPTSPPPVRREPTPTPRVSECVSYRWTTVQVFRPSAQVLTEIKAEQQLQPRHRPPELMFEISGWRDGGLVQSVRAMPLRPHPPPPLGNHQRRVAGFDRLV